MTCILLLKRGQEGNASEEVMREAERIEAREKAIHEARQRGEKIARTPETLQEQIANNITMYKADGIKYGKEPLAEKLGYDMFQFVEQIKGKDDASSDYVNSYVTSYEEAIRALLPDIQKDPKLKAIYEEALREKRAQRRAFDNVINAPNWETLPEEEKSKRMSLLKKLDEMLYKYRKQADPNFSKTS